MIRPWHTWTAFVVSLAVVFAAMAWTSVTVLRLDRAEALATQLAEREEAVRLALWRMDSALAPLVAQVGGLPYFVYKPFYPADRAYTLMFEEVEPGEVLLPSPLLTLESRHILLHFQFHPDGRITSPQAPAGDMRELVEESQTEYNKMDIAAARLAALTEKIDIDRLLAAVPLEAPQVLAMAQPPEPTLQPGRKSLGQQAAVQQQRSAVERRARMQQQQVDNIASNLMVPLPGALSASTEVSAGVIRPLWIDDTLLLARRVSVQGEDYVQGCWLDWPEIQQWLRGEIRDLLPEAQLAPVRAVPPVEDVHLLAALPVRLIPGAIPAQSAQRTSPVRISLLIAWICVILGGTAVAVFLAGTVSLSERRATFISAVTHEMRTPLTTVRMYTDMLVKGMVPNEEKRQRYLETLRTEAQRLGHLVENVLAYSRVERVREKNRAETITLSEVLGRVEDRLAARAQQAGMMLATKADETALARRVCVDITAVEQILFNLVDNACKYAASASDRTLHLEFDVAGEQALIRVRDHGPGITGTQQRRLFRAFSKSAQDAAQSAPGIGLGLALSRRLARRMGGNLELKQDQRAGATFVLTLPQA